MRLPASTNTTTANGQASQNNTRTEPPHLYEQHKKAQETSLTWGQNAYPSFGGFGNLMALCLFVSNLRLMIENYRKYGVLINFSNHDYSNEDMYGGLALYFFIPCHLFVAWGIEKLAASMAKAADGRIHKVEDPGLRQAIRDRVKGYWWFIAFLHATNAMYLLKVATLRVYYDIHHPGIGTLCELHAIVIAMKITSYAFTNRDLRDVYLNPDKFSAPEGYAACPYPSNITFGNLCYFWWAPTLVYQPVYKRTASVNKSRLLSCCVEFLVLAGAIWITSAQYAAPLLQNSLETFLALDLVSIAERVMKLSTISVICWLMGFYALFQSALNGLAEVMRFADREFYTDWWNVDSIRDYWTSWNKPVTNFMKRHVYVPLRKRGVPQFLAQIIVFIISAILHELLVGVPTHNILGVAFIGMMAQIPLILITDFIKWCGLKNKRVGNMIFWLSFCILGQPLAALLYFFAWHAKYGSVSKQFQDSSAAHLSFLRR